ncbi:hypothetical protein ACQ4M4_09080 [Leptolyngbya sp. AN02str]|uniref:hypothetical protein n=1 Tax=Leptolyngbya sp. AN02str TaxID=3423363 RepID=UPI003D320A5C
MGNRIYLSQNPSSEAYSSADPPTENPHQCPNHLPKNTTDHNPESTLHQPRSEQRCLTRCWQGQTRDQKQRCLVACWVDELKSP